MIVCSPTNGIRYRRDSRAKSTARTSSSYGAFSARTRWTVVDPFDRTRHRAWDTLSSLHPSRRYPTGCDDVLPWPCMRRHWSVSKQVATCTRHTHIHTSRHSVRLSCWRASNEKREDQQLSALHRQSEQGEICWASLRVKEPEKRRSRCGTVTYVMHQGPGSESSCAFAIRLQTAAGAQGASLRL